MSFRVRPAVPADVRAIRALVEPYAAERILLAKEWVGYYEAVQEFLVVEADDGTVTGCGALHVMWQDLAEIRTLAVDRAWRGTGIGHALLDALLERARELGLRRVFCLTFEVAFFESHGFHVIEGTPVHARRLPRAAAIARRRRRRVPRPGPREAEHPGQHPDAHRAGLTPLFTCRPAPDGHACRVSTYLTTDRLTLRPFTADEADLLIELDSDPAVMRFLSGGAPTAPELVRDRDLPGILAGYERWDERFGLFAAQEKDGGTFVGWFCLRPERDGPLDDVELGYRLRQEAWGHGYASEVAAALVDKAFSELDVRVVWGATMLPEPRFAEGDGEGRHDRQRHAGDARRHAGRRALRPRRPEVRDHEGPVGGTAVAGSRLTGQPRTSSIPAGVLRTSTTERDWPSGRCTVTTSGAPGGRVECAIWIRITSAVAGIAVVAGGRARLPGGAVLGHLHLRQPMPYLVEEVVHLVLGVPLPELRRMEPDALDLPHRHGVAGGLAPLEPLDRAGHPVEEVVDLVLVVALPELGGGELVVEDVVGAQHAAHAATPVTTAAGTSVGSSSLAAGSRVTSPSATRASTQRAS